jgi:hypothetical protein
MLAAVWSDLHHQRGGSQNLVQGLQLWQAKALRQLEQLA